MKHLVKFHIFRPSVLFLFVFIAFSISGYTINIYNYIMLVLFVLWLFVAIIEEPSSMINAFLKRKVIYFFIFIIYYFLSSIFVADLNYSAKYIGTFILHFLSSMLIFNFYKKDYSSMRVICVFSLVIWIFFCIRSIIFYNFNPAAARLLAADTFAFNTIAIGGGYALAFGSALLSVFFVDIILYKLTMGDRFFSLFGIVIILSILVIKTESSLTIIGMLFGWAISIISRLYNGRQLKIENKYFIKVLIITLLLVIIIIFILNINTIGVLLYEITLRKIDVLFFRRINRIAEKFVFFGKDMTYNYNYIDERMQTILLSLDTFIRNPIFGVGHKFGNIFNLAESYGIGTHSAWIDALASFGLIGGFPYIMIYISSIKEDKARKYFPIHSYIITTCFLCIVNPFQTFQSCFALFFMIPGLSWYFSKRNKI